ncbi:MAG: cell division ATP-binding protein FtsE [Candidatus Marinimicrobia bacterium]|nr:cell division ATP-binding protein FtsE [Candidatus Neomarinimicrobiota bacterium]
MIVFENVTSTFPKGAGVKDINISVNTGEFVFLIGPSGAGKSTILRLIYMDIFPDKGRVKVYKYDSDSIKYRDIPYLRRKIGMIFQDFKLLNDRNVYQNVALSLYISRFSYKDIKHKVLDVLNSVGLGHRVHYKPQELSGGEQQRVAIARALVKSPIVLLADEPTGNLDPKVSADLMRLLKKINEEGTAIVMATHNYKLIDYIPNPRIIQIDKGRIVNIS